MAEVHIIQVENTEEIRRQIEESEKVMAHVQNMGKEDLIDQITYARRFCIQIQAEAIFALRVTTTTDGFPSTDIQDLQDMWLNMWSLVNSFQKKNADLADKFSLTQGDRDE